jgi:hypothetical protein
MVKIKLDSKDNSYNLDTYLRESHNCYSYFLNLKSGAAYSLCKKNFAKQNICRRSQPGYASNYPSLETKDFNCPTIMKRTLDDNKKMFQVTKDFQCGPDYYKGAVVVAPGRDYHYYRLNDDKIWTHKPGYKPSTVYDACGNIILDPEKAVRNYGGTLNYTDFCGYTCIPRDPKMKHMEMYNKSDDAGRIQPNYNNPLNPLKRTLNKSVKNIIRKRNKTNKNKNKNK